MRAKKKLPWVLGGVEKANKKWTKKTVHNSSRNEASFQTLMYVGKVRDDNLMGNDWLIMEKWKQYFYETLNIKDNVEIREEVIYQGLEEQIELQQKMRYGK